MQLQISWITIHIQFKSLGDFIGFKHFTLVKLFRWLVAQNEIHASKWSSTSTRLYKNVQLVNHSFLSAFEYGSDLQNDKMRQLKQNPLTYDENGWIYFLCSGSRNKMSVETHTSASPVYHMVPIYGLESCSLNDEKTGPAKIAMPIWASREGSIVTCCWKSVALVQIYGDISYTTSPRTPVMEREWDELRGLHPKRFCTDERQDL